MNTKTTKRQELEIGTTRYAHKHCLAMFKQLGVLLCDGATGRDFEDLKIILSGFHWSKESRDRISECADAIQFDIDLFNKRMQEQLQEQKGENDNGDTTSKAKD